MQRNQPALFSVRTRSKSDAQKIREHNARLREAELASKATHEDDEHDEEDKHVDDDKHEEDDKYVELHVYSQRVTGSTVIHNDDLSHEDYM